MDQWSDIQVTLQRIKQAALGVEYARTGAQRRRLRTPTSGTRIASLTNGGQTSSRIWRALLVSRADNPVRGHRAV